MNPSASLTASSVIFNTGSENFGVITAANVTFNDGSANSGTVTGDAQFNGTSVLRASGVVTGDATFAFTAVREEGSTVTGTVVVLPEIIAGYTVDVVNGVRIITSDINLNNQNLTELPDFSGVVVNGSFYCAGNQLTSLQGAPANVSGNFHCFINQLTSLQGAPATVGGNFYCDSNQLTSLQGAPATVGGAFSCQSNQLTSLQGAPATVVVGFDCRQNSLLTSLQGIGIVAGNVNFDSSIISEVITNSDGSGYYVAAGSATLYPTSEEAQAAQGNAEYPAWLAANTGVNSYPGAGSHNGQWAYDSTEYGSEAEAQAAADAANQ